MSRSGVPDFEFAAAAGLLTDVANVADEEEVVAGAGRVLPAALVARRDAAAHRPWRRARDRGAIHALQSVSEND